jgi:hypothetical protein
MIHFLNTLALIAAVIFAALTVTLIFDRLPSGGRR